MLALLRDPMTGRQWTSARQRNAWRPPTDVYETRNAMVVKVEIAGMREQDFEVWLDGRHLTIRGARHDPSDKLGYQQMEIQYGAFETDVHLPKAVDEDKIEASYRNGFLVVRLPKTQSRKVPITATQES
jgi:HSP20 family protein